jgi:hypothetical protein
MKSEHELDSLYEQLEVIERDLNRLEGKMLEFLQLMYVDAKLAEWCASRKGVIALTGGLTRRAHDQRVRERRASLKVIRTIPSDDRSASERLA